MSRNLTTILGALGGAMLLAGTLRQATADPRDRHPRVSVLTAQEIGRLQIILSACQDG